MSNTAVATGKLNSSDTTDFDAYLVLSEYKVKPADQDAKEPIADRVSTRPNDEGAFRMEIPSPDIRLGETTFRAYDGRGMVVGETVVARDGDLEGVVIEVVVAPPTTIEPSDDPSLGARTRFSGRVLDTSGSGYPADHQVLLWAQYDTDDALTPLSVAMTRSGGYFSGPWTDGQFAAIFATVADSEPLPVPLDDGAMPTNILLVVDPPSEDSADGDCGCGCSDGQTPHAPEPADLVTSPDTFAQDPGTCVSFTVPDRTIDEVTYQAAVRTTQPMLKSQVPIEEQELPGELLERLAGLVLRRPQKVRRRPVDATSAPIPAQLPSGQVATRPGPGGGRRPAAVDARRAIPAPDRSAEAEIDRSKPLVRPIAERPIDIGDDGVVAAGLRAAQRYAPGLDLDGGWLSSTPDLRAEQVLARRLDDDSPLELDSSVLAEMVRNPGAVTPRDLIRGEHRSVMRRFRRRVKLIARTFSGRFTLDDDAQIAWDEIPDSCQAVGISHGHLLSIKQVWRADGYSQGDPLYSLPLAPGQQKLVSFIDWNRSEVASRRASRTATEDLVADLSHDNDIAETITSVLSEEMSGSSKARNGSIGSVVGGFVGPIIFGAAGGYSAADSSAQQSSTREISGEALQTFRDRTTQAASAVRSQRTSVVQVGRQSESVRAQTEVIANYNHCHSMTVHYFEVLRHLQVTMELAGVQECLFVPLAMSDFTAAKTLRWRRHLTRALRRRSLRPAFAALERVETDWADAHVPEGRHADETVIDIEGELWLTIELPRPADTTDGDYDSAAWAVYDAHFSDTQETWERYLGVALEEDRDAIWETRLAPTVIQSMVDDLDLWLQTEIWYVFPTIDATMVGTYRPGVPLQVTFRAETPLPEVTRAEITSLVFTMYSADLPANGSIIVDSATARYRTDYLSTTFFENRRVHNDISLGDSVYISAPLSKLDKRNPKELDQRRSDELLEHLGEHIEYYHRAIWMTMDPNRLFMLLDGVIAPNADGRSIASVVENRVLGVVGNSLIMPVAPGVKLDPTYEFADSTNEDLRHLYAADPPPPMRISFPTSGVYAEAVLGSCNTCETIDDTRFWRFEDAPIPDSPTAIDPISMASRRTTPPNLAPDEFADPLVGYQTVPETPVPTGLAAAMDALGTSDVFRDMTGLALNQANSAAGLEATMNAAQGFATKAGALAQQQFLTREVDRTVDLIEGMENVSDEDKQSFTEALFRGALGQVRPNVASPSDSELVKTGVDKLSGGASGSITHKTPYGTAHFAVGSAAAPIDVDIDPMLVPIQQRSINVCWAAGATMMENWRQRRDDPVDVVVDRLGPTWRSRYDQDLLVSIAQFRTMAATLGWQEEPPQSYTPTSLASLVESTGAVLAIGDDAVANNGISHVRIIVAIDGDGTSAGTLVTAADSATGLLTTMSFAAFEALHHASDAVNTDLGFFHY